MVIIVAGGAEKIRGRDTTAAETARAGAHRSHPGRTCDKGTGSG